MATKPVLFGDVLRSAVTRWREELGTSDRIRFDALLGLSVTPHIRLSDGLEKLFPGLDQKKAQTAFTSFRKRLNDAAQRVGGVDLGFHLHVDTKKQNPPAERICWFTGPDPAINQVERYSEELTADIAGKPVVPTKGLATTGAAMASGKRPVRIFVSYAHADRPLFASLMKELRLQLATSRNYEFSIWTDRDIFAGEHWQESITKALQACDCGLLLLSPAFLASSFIGQHEIPRFVGAPDNPKLKPVIPVGLVQVSFEKQNLKGIEKHQIFLGQTDQTDGRFFDLIQGSGKRRDFIHKLYLALEKRLDAFFTSTPPPSPPSGQHSPSVRTADAITDRLLASEAPPHFQKTRGHRIALSDLEPLEPSATGSPVRGEPRDALKELESWATSTHPETPRFFALLGEYGIGKTTTLKHFTRRLLDKRKSDSTLPLPIYVDLRDYVGAAKDDVPTIEQLLAGIIERSWKLSDRNITPKDVLRLVREEGAVILFDGLDEKIVHLTPANAQHFIRALWAVLPEAARPNAPLAEGKRSGKLLISCRSHYFRDVMSQNSMLVGEDREGFDRKQFPALCLLPFTEEQIRAYLESLLGGKEGADEAFEVIESIHNLRELAERPYLLSLISDRLGELERLRARGEKVNAARLYELVVKSWLNRDEGKHQLDPVHKLQLMEELAAALWREGTQQWNVDRLESWLDDYLTASPKLISIYANKDRAVLKEDLRTATFVLRPTTEENRFRFAHTSLQEYFLAAYLARALIEGNLDQWNLPEVSWETLDFLGQILDIKHDLKALRSLETILGSDVLQAAVLAFAYWLRAIEQGFPVPAPARIKLAGADLEEWHIRGRSPEQPLNLLGADLSHVRLNRARVEHVNLADADLRGLQARQALFLRVSAPRVRAQGIDFRGLRWREGSLLGAELRGAQLAGCQWIWVSLAGANLPESWKRHATALEDRRGGSPLQTGTPRLASTTGHYDSVRACAWSPDGQRLLSGSGDNSLKVWDASSGECLLTLSGHSFLVRACAWSPDGQRLLSGSDDNSLKVWDASSGRCSWSGHTFPEGQIASVDDVHGRILHASPEAWRWLGWRWTDPATGRLRLLPAEAFGPLPA